MNIYDIMMNVLFVGAFASVSAQIINYSYDSAEKSRIKKKEILRKLHIAALKGCESSAKEWDSLRNK